MSNLVSRIDDIKWNDYYPGDTIPRGGGSGDGEEGTGCFYAILGVGVGLIASVAFLASVAFATFA